MPTGKKIVRRSRPAADNSASSSRQEDTNRSHADESSDKASNRNDIEMASNHKSTTDHDSVIAKNDNKPSSVSKKPHLDKISNQNYHRSGDSRVLDSDLEEQSLLVEDIDTFLLGAGPSGDPYDGYYEGTRVQWEYQHDRRGGHMLFIENEDTGELVLTDANGN
jgi:hypothetical protein